MFPNEKFGCFQSGFSPMGHGAAGGDAACMNDDYPILAAVAAHPTHPYALLEHLGQTGLAVTRSTLYRRVEALVAQGWLAADDIRGENGHFRRALSLTRSGRERVRKETLAVLKEEPLESPQFALAVAAAGNESPEALTAVLRPRMALAARRLTEEERSLSAQGPSVQGVAQSRRIAHLQADISWLQGLLGRRTVEASGGERASAQRVVHG